MTSLTPRRDALVIAFAAARLAARELPPARDRSEAISRELSHAVMESAMLPLAEARDLGIDARTANAMLVNALANTIVSHCLCCADSDAVQAQHDGIALIHALVDRCRTGFNEPAAVEIVQDICDADAGRAQ